MFRAYIVYRWRKSYQRFSGLDRLLRALGRFLTPISTNHLLGLPVASLGIGLSLAIYWTLFEASLSNREMSLSRIKKIAWGEQMDPTGIESIDRFLTLLLHGNCRRRNAKTLTRRETSHRTVTI